LTSREGPHIITNFGLIRKARPWQRGQLARIYIKLQIEVSGMAFEQLKAEIGLILEMFSNPPHDRFELYMQLKEKLNEMRAFGMTPPSDLIELEEALDREFSERNASGASASDPAS
jgi:hypothetical protein